MKSQQNITAREKRCIHAGEHRQQAHAPDKPARKIPSLPGLVTVLDRKSESEQKGENGVGLAGKQEKKTSLNCWLAASIIGEEATG